MGINFLGLGIGKIQNNIKINSYSKNVNFKGGLDNDEIQLSEKAQVQKRIAQLEKEIAQLSNEINALKKLWHFDREGLHKEYTQKRKKCAELKKEHDFLIRTLKFLNSGLEQTRPNSAFLYDPRLSDKQKYEILSKHPEIKSLKQISEESANKNAIYEVPISKLFIEDGFDFHAYIDTSNPLNKENYELVTTQLQNKVPLDTIYKQLKSEVDEDEFRELARRTLDLAKAKNPKNGKNVRIYLVDDDLLQKTKNIDTLFPKKSKYYKSALRDKNEPLLVPLTYLSSLGYGTPKQIYALFKKGYFKGSEKTIEKDGRKIKHVMIDISSTAAEVNLETLREKNKNLYSISQLASMLGVRLSEVEKAVINGDLDAINEYITLPYNYDYESKIDLNNPKNQQYASRMALVQEVKKELLAQQKEKNKTLFGLTSKIAWALSPNTREDFSRLAKDNAYIAQILEKLQRIKEAQQTLKETETEDDSAENETNADKINIEEINDKEVNTEISETIKKVPTVESLTEKEEIALASYRKKVWDLSGTQEYSEAYKKAMELVKIYDTQGLAAIEDEQIKDIIRNYME